MALVRAGGCQTTAVSEGLSGSGWLPLLEQQAALRCQHDALAPVYAQYALGQGLVLCRYDPAPGGVRQGHVVRQLYFSGDELGALAPVRPLSSKALRDWESGANGADGALEGVPVSALSDQSALRAGLDLVGEVLSEWLLERLLMALRGAARDKRLSVRITLGGSAAAVAEKGRLLMDTLMRAMPLWDMLRLSWCVSPTAETALPCDARVSPPQPDGQAGRGSVVFDLVNGDMYWPGGAPAPDGLASDMAAALMRGDIEAVDRLRAGGSLRAAPAKPAGHEGAGPEPHSALLTEEFGAFTAGLDEKRAALDREAYAALTTSEWHRQIARIIELGDTMPRWDYIDQLSQLIVGLTKGRRAAALNASDRVLSDLSAVLLDTISWDDVDLTLPAHLKVIRRAMRCVELLLPGACGEGCFLSSRVMRALCDMPAASSREMIGDLSRLCELQVAAYGAIQACARRYFDRRCEQTRVGEDEFILADEMLVGAAVIVWSRFEGGIPDFRLLDLARDAVEGAGGERQARRFDRILDRMRRGMHRSRPATPRRREMLVMLAISLVLALIILTVILSYFLFIR